MTDDDDPGPAPTEAPGLPSREALRRFVRESPGRVGKREVARAFDVPAGERAALRDTLKDLAREGGIAPAGHRRFQPPGRLGDQAVVVVTGTDPQGDAVARPSDAGTGPAPLVLMAPEPRGQPALAPGERVLARLRPLGPGRYEGRTLRRLGEAPGRVLGVFRAAAGREPARIVPTDRRSRAEWIVPAGEEGGALPGEIVLATPLPSRGYGLKPARVLERLGPLGDARSVSLVVLHGLDIPQVFPPEALAEADAAGAVALAGREDLRHVPLVTIDGEDARDFDDAVFAEADGDGFRLLVAIADVAGYVRPDGALDREARRRGNSVYFPDRVVPMLPEALSNGWCSLRPDEDRGCLFVELRIDAAGHKTAHRFGRGLMRSRARLTYEAMQAAADGGTELDLPDGLVGALYGAYAALRVAREVRGTLELDLPERRVVLDDAGRVLSVAPRQRLHSHRLVEEFMVLANVAAAEELERLHRPCVYRVHAPPTEERLEGLRTVLHGMDIALPPGDQLHPRDLDRVLAAVAGTEQAGLVNEIMLRAQSQAAYDPDNIGHFGLALPRYAHFTSPIRRYADLLVHRALIGGLRLGEGAPAPAAPEALADVAEHITVTERRAAAAEREAVERYLAAFMADKVGACFPARISGVTRFGLFVTLDESGAAGLVPLRSLPDDNWMHDPATQSLTGRRSGVSWRLAQAVEVRLSEAAPVTGGLVFALLAEAPKRGARTAKGERRGRPA